MHFEVRGTLGGESVTVRWENGQVTSENERALRTLERRARMMDDESFGPMSLDSGSEPPHLADPYKILFLLIYETHFPSILDDGEILSMDLPSEIPKGAVN